MYLEEHTRVCLLHAISPIHAGSGTATGAVDLPIQRERHTGWPQIQSSGVKGAFRDHCLRRWACSTTILEPFSSKVKEAEEAANRIFGSDTGNGGGQAGAVAFSDARLLVFPVRASAAPFVWVTCPALVRRARRDLQLAGLGDATQETPVPAEDSFLVLRDTNGVIKEDLILEDLCLSRDNRESPEPAGFFKFLAKDLERLVLIPDHHFSFLVETATEIQAQIKIDPATGTTTDGSLRYEELLPAETVMYCLVFFGDERIREADPLKVKNIAEMVTAAVSGHIQMGGDQTLGRGIFSLTWLTRNDNEGGE